MQYSPEILNRINEEREALTPEQRMVRALENIEDLLRDIKSTQLGDSHNLGWILKNMSK